MALRDTHIALDIVADADPLREVNNQINDTIRSATVMNATLNDVGGRTVQNYRRMSDSTNWLMMSTRGMSQEALQMKREMMGAYQAQRQAMIPFRNEMMKTQYGYFKLAQAAGDYSGRTKDYMREIEKLGKAHKKTTDAMMAADEMRKVGFIRTIGTMLARSTQASKISDNYNRMGNPLYRVNNGLLSVADNMNKIAMRGQPAAVALRLLGPTANMKQLNDMTMMITQGLMRFTMVALIAAAGAAIFYSAMHKMAMDTSRAYNRSFMAMVSSLRQAITPIVNAFIAIMVPIFKFITAISNMVVAFNKAHPSIAKLIGFFLVLLPIVTLLLTPLAIGVGLFGGLSAAMGAVWPFIGPIVTGFAAMMGTVIVVTAAIVGLVAGIRHLWTTNEAFRNAVVGAWEAIRAKAVEVFGFIAAFLGPIISGALAKLTDFATQAMGLIKQAFTGDFSGIFELFKQFIPNIIGFLIGGIPGLIIAGARFIPAITEGIQSNAGNLAFTIGGIVQDIAAFLLTKVPLFINEGVRIIQNLIQGVTQSLPIIVEAVSNIVLLLVSTIAQVLPVMLQAGIKIITALIAGITTLLPVIITTGINILMTLINGILSMIPALIPVALRIITILINKLVALIPMLLELGVQLIQGLLNGLAQALPMLLNGALQVIMGLVNALMVNLPLILNAGIQILMALLDGIIQMLPVLLNTAMTIIMQLVQTLTSLLPQLITVGIEILLKLIDGIVQMLPQLITMAVNLITQLTNTLVANLPMIINAGVQILVSLINGIIQMLPQLVAAALQLMVALFQAIIQHAPQLLSAGVQLIQALINGALSLLGAVSSAMLSIGSTIMNTIRGIDLTEIGRNIIQGLIGGISSMIGAVAKTISSVANTVKEGIAGVLGIASPSKLMIEYGGWTTEGFAIGMMDEIRRVDQASKEIALTADQPVAGFTPETSPSTSTTNNSSQRTLNFSPVINVTSNGSGDEVGVRQQVKEAVDEVFANLLDLYDPEVSY